MTVKYHGLFDDNPTDENVMADQLLYAVLKLVPQIGALVDVLAKLHLTEDELQRTGYLAEAKHNLACAVAMLAQIGERLGLPWYEVVDYGYKRMVEKSREYHHGTHTGQ